MRRAPEALGVWNSLADPVGADLQEGKGPRVRDLNGRAGARRRMKAIRGQLPLRA